MTAPRVEVGRVWLNILVTRSDAVRMKDELVRGEKQAAIETLDALGAGRVVPGGHKGSATTPGALVEHRKGEIVGKARRCVVAQEGLAQPFCLSTRYHATPSRTDGHRTGPTEDLQLHWSTLDTSNSESHAAIVNLVVAELLQQSVRDLGETESFLRLDEQGDYRDAVEHDCADLEVQ